MNILVLGASTIFKNRMLPALEKIDEIIHIDVASLTKGYKAQNHSKIRNVYADYDEALTNSDAQLVYVSVRNHEHVAIGKKALLQNKHVIIDKPAALDANSAKMLVELACIKNKCIAEALVYQYHPQITRTIQLFRNASVIPTHVSVNFTIPGLNSDNYRYDPSSGGGAIYDMASYAMSIGMQFFNSPLIDCLGFKKKYGNNVETAFSISLAYEGSQTLNGFFGFETEYMNAATIFGKGMSVSIDRVFTPPAHIESELLIKLANQQIVEKMKQVDTFKLFVEDVLNCIFRNNFHHFGMKLVDNAAKLELLNKKLNEI